MLTKRASVPLLQYNSSVLNFFASYPILIINNYLKLSALFPKSNEYVSLICWDLALV
jgi:hypothetical protein